MSILFWILLFCQSLQFLVPNGLRHKLRIPNKFICLLLRLKGKARYYRKSIPVATKAVTVPTNPGMTEFNPPFKSGRRFRKKPEWVRKKVIRLLALNPHTSLRGIEYIFNRSEAFASGETVSHTYVGQVLMAHAYEIQTLSKEKHNQRPKPVPQHLIWAADLTFLPDAEGKPQPILGMVEHASRACLALTTIHNKGSVTLLRVIADVIEFTGKKPKFLRTDNEPVFTSKVFRFGLRFLGIKHQTTEVASPWQNGKMERFFGVFKQKARGLVFNTGEELDHHLVPFRFWYNHIRPHGYLDGLTPFEAYHKQGITCTQPGQEEPLFFRAWNDRLTGFWFRRE